MWQTIRKQTRPSLDVAFFGPAHSPGVQPTFKQYWQDTYINSDKLIYAHTELSEDQLEMTITMIWDSRETVDAMLADATVIAEFLPIKNAYLEANGMTEIVISNEEI